MDNSHSDAIEIAAYREKYGLKQYAYRIYHGEQWQVYETVTLCHVAFYDIEDHAQACVLRLNAAIDLAKERATVAPQEPGNPAEAARLRWFLDKMHSAVCANDPLSGQPNLYRHTLSVNWISVHADFGKVLEELVRGGQDVTLSVPAVSEQTNQPLPPKTLQENDILRPQDWNASLYDVIQTGMRVAEQAGGLLILRSRAKTLVKGQDVNRTCRYKAAVIDVRGADLQTIYGDTLTPLPSTAMHDFTRYALFVHGEQGWQLWATCLMTDEELQHITSTLQAVSS